MLPSPATGELDHCVERMVQPSHQRATGTNFAVATRSWRRLTNEEPPTSKM
jgi:hypothetical protein